MQENKLWSDKCNRKDFMVERVNRVVFLGMKEMNSVGNLDLCFVKRPKVFHKVFHKTVVL